MRWIHVSQRIVSVTFSLLSLRIATGYEYALYAASRSVALPLATLYAMTRRSREGIAALSFAMTPVQLFDAFIGGCISDLNRAYGPIALAANFH
jgi:hypothetical protein